MDREALALSLKLPKESSEAVIFEALAKRDAEGRKAVESLATLTGQLPGFGLKLDGASLVRVEPVKLDLQPDPADTAQVAEYKKRLREADANAALAAATANKEFVAKLSQSMKLPPSMMGLAEELLSVEGGAESLMLAKDGKTVNRGKIESIKEKAKALLSALSSIGGVKFPTSSTEPDADAEKLAREKAYAEHFAKHSDAGAKKSEEVAAAK